MYVGGKQSINSAVTITGLRFVNAKAEAMQTAAAKFPLIPTIRANANAIKAVPVIRGKIEPPLHPKLMHI